MSTVGRKKVIEFMKISYQNISNVKFSEVGHSIFDLSRKMLILDPEYLFANNSYKTRIKRVKKQQILIDVSRPAGQLFPANMRSAFENSFQNFGDSIK